MTSRVVIVRNSPVTTNGGAVVLNKPFQRHELLAAVRTALISDSPVHPVEEAQEL